MRTLGALVLALLVLSGPRARAQDAVAPSAPSVPPVMIVSLASGHVDDSLRLAVESALVEGVRPMAGGRPVLALAQPDLRARVAACADAASQGAFIAEMGAIGAIVARLARTGTRGNVLLTLDMIDPVSGASRVPQITASLASEADAASLLTPLIEQLRPAMFSPPPAPPTLLVTVNVDGATVAIDEAVVGHAPIASQRLTPGSHVVQITQAGYSGTQRTIDLEPGEQARLDINLVPLTATAIAAEREATEGPRAPEVYEEWWFWTAIAGGVAVIAGIIIGVVVASQPPPPTPDPMGIGLPAIRF